MNQINPVALFRLSVLGPLISPEQLQRGELQTIIRQLAQREYAIPDSDRRMLGEKTIQSWYYAWRKGGIDALVPKVRVDRGSSKMSATVQEAILAAKRENPRRSINQIARGAGGRWSGAPTEPVALQRAPPAAAKWPVPDERIVQPARGET